MADRPTPDATFERWTRHQPTVFFGAPTGFAGMLASPRLPARSAVALRMCPSAGEALPAEIAQRFKDHFGCDIIDGIGSTEMLHIFLSNRPDDVRYGSTGKPFRPTTAWDDPWGFRHMLKFESQNMAGPVGFHDFEPLPAAEVPQTSRGGILTERSSRR